MEKYDIYLREHNFLVGNFKVRQSGGYKHCPGTDNNWCYDDISIVDYEPIMKEKHLKINYHNLNVTTINAIN